MEQVTQDMQKIIVSQAAQKNEQFVNGKFVQDETDDTMMIMLLIKITHLCWKYEFDRIQRSISLRSHTVRRDNKRGCQGIDLNYTLHGKSVKHSKCSQTQSYILYCSRMTATLLNKIR